LRHWYFLRIISLRDALRVKRAISIIRIILEIIPAIIAKNIDEISHKLKMVEPYCDWVQIDVSDGIFTKNTTWNNPAELKNINTKASLEAHLMISDTESHIAEWIDSGVKRILVPVDSTSDFQKILQMAEAVKSKGLQFVIALNPEVLIDEVKELIPLSDIVLLLAVNPGFSGQKFLPETIKKIRDLRKEFPDVKIEVDGGINKETAKECVKAGADILVSASYIFESKDIKRAIEDLND